MKVEITKTGIYDPEGKKVPVGRTFDLGPDIKEIPAVFVGKCRRLDGVPDSAEAVTNETQVVQLDPSAQERQDLLKNIAVTLKDDDFSGTGLPKVGSVNAEAEVKFDGTEIATLYPAIADAVKSARTAPA